MSNKNYIVNTFRKILKEDLEEKAESLMNKLDYNKTLKLNKDNEFDYVQEEDNMEGSNMCESCGGEMNEGECSECGNMYEIDLQELGGMDDGHPRFGKTKFKNQMTNDCYKPSLEERLAKLEEETIDTNIMLFELSIDIDMIKDRLITLENLVIGDDK